MLYISSRLAVDTRNFIISNFSFCISQDKKVFIDFSINLFIFMFVFKITTSMTKHSLISFNFCIFYDIFPFSLNPFFYQLNSNFSICISKWIFVKFTYLKIPVDILTLCCIQVSLNIILLIIVSLMSIIFSCKNLFLQFLFITVPIYLCHRQYFASIQVMLNAWIIHFNKAVCE